jgi:hypothetical protein
MGSPRKGGQNILEKKLTALVSQITIIIKLQKDLVMNGNKLGELESLNIMNLVLKIVILLQWCPLKFRMLFQCECRGTFSAYLS